MCLMEEEDAISPGIAIMEFVSHRVNVKKQIQVLCKDSKCS